MKNRFTKLFKSGIIMLGSMFILNNNAVAQDGMGDLMSLGNDAKGVLEGYLGPLGQTLGINMNSGWYNTAQPLRLGRFEMKFVMPVTMPNEASKNFDPSSFLGEGWSAPNQSPTVFGDRNAEPGYITRTIGDENYEEEISIQLPKGYLPANLLPPTIQLSVGLIKGTEVMGRFIPTLSVAGASVSSWGLGVKHDVKQWIPVVKRLPFDLSVLAAFSKLDLSYEFDPILPVPSSVNAINEDGSAYDPSVYSNQGISLKNTAWNLNLIVSKKVALFTPYAGLRYGSSNSVLGLDGVFGYANGQVRQQGTQYYAEITNFEDGELKVEMPLNQFSANMGFRLKLAVMTIFAEANFGKFNTYSGGIGFGFLN